MLLLLFANLSIPPEIIELKAIETISTLLVSLVFMTLSLIFKILNKQLIFIICEWNKKLTNIQLKNTDKSHFLKIFINLPKTKTIIP